MVFTQSKPLATVGQWLCGLFFILAMGLTGPAWAKDQPIPKLDNWLVDTTGTFNAAQKKALTDRLAAFEKNKGAQIFVLVVPTTGDEVIEQYTRRVYDQWKVGRKKVDDGILLVVAKEDRRLRIEVGYGLEGAVTDLQAGRIIREFITPYFAQGDYVGGINNGVDKIMGLVEGEDLPPPVKAKTLETGEQGPFDILVPMVFFAVVLPVIFAFVLPPVAAALVIGLFSYFLFWSLPLAILAGIVASILSLVGKAFRASDKGNSAHASRRGAAIGGLGGGFGGGGFGSGGGFGGGGGGSSGGGGASGSW